MITVRVLLDEYDLDISDIRWLLSTQEVERVLGYKNNPTELIQQYFNGDISSKLYNWDERYLEELQNDLERNMVDETHIREMFQKALLLKKERLTLGVNPFSKAKGTL